jgi:hypothetical protein
VIRRSIDFQVFQDFLMLAPQENLSLYKPHDFPLLIHGLPPFLPQPG